MYTRNMPDAQTTLSVEVVSQVYKQTFHKRDAGLSTDTGAASGSMLSNVTPSTLAELTIRMNYLSGRRVVSKDIYLSRERLVSAYHKMIGKKE